MTVLAPQRQAHILEVVRRAGGVRVSEIVRALGVSDMTVRRDLEALAARGLLAKVHGGATAILTPSTHEPGFAAKSTRQRVEKEAIAAQAATLVNPGTAIAISAGTTTYALTRWLVDVPGLTVVTNSVQVADLFHQGDGIFFRDPKPTFYFRERVLPPSQHDIPGFFSHNLVQSAEKGVGFDVEKLPIHGCDVSLFVLHIPTKGC